MPGTLMAKSKEPAALAYMPQAGTSTVRVNADLGYMISWICEIEDIKQHELLDPLVRSSIAARFERIRPTVEQIEELKRKGKPKAE